MGNGIYRRPLWSCMKKVFGCTWKKHNRTAQVSTSLSVAAMLPHPSMNDTPSHFEQNAVLPHPVHFFHVLIFHFRKQIISWRMYGVIAEGFDHSLDHLDTWKPFAFSHTNKCLLATDSLRHLVRWGNTMLPHQVPYRDMAHASGLVKPTDKNVTSTFTSSSGPAQPLGARISHT